MAINFANKLSQVFAESIRAKQHLMTATPFYS